VSEAVRRFHGSKYWLHAFVVMDDHLHVLVSPIALHSLESIVGPWKSITTRRIWESSGRTGKIWQEEYFDRIVRDQEEFLEKARYILNNPLKRWPELRDYRWVGAENEWSEGAGTASRPHQDA
jgi:REP element-mobilizing transposase RayT